jgi:large subunit ribosomal protein L22
MQAKASLKFARIKPRKVRMILDMVRGKRVGEAVDELRFTRKAAAPMVNKLLDSAIANAQQQKADVNLDKLIIKLAYADKAPDANMHRWRPRAQGRATPITKGMSHIHVVLEETEN